MQSNNRGKAAESEEMSTTMEKQAIDLSWVTAAGGPELHCEDGRNVTGLPEEGWWVWDKDFLSKLGKEDAELHLHTEWTEPVTGAAGTLMAGLHPSGEGVAWHVTFVFKTPDGEHHYPMRVDGVAPDFDSARKAAIEWRPTVQVIDGVELWTDPAAMRGEARGLHSGDLTWQPSTEPAGSIAWRFKPAGLEDLLDQFDWYSRQIGGTASTLAQMLTQVDESRERIRAAMRKFLLNY